MEVWEGRTFEGNALWQVNRRMCPAQSILGVATAWLHHFVKSNDTVTGLELGDIGADFVHDAGDVVALVHGF